MDDAILDSALDLFAAGGLGAVTFEGVATRAGVGRSAVYRRWSEREDLVVAALTRHRAQGEVGAENWATSGSVATVMALFVDRAAHALTDRRSLGLLGQVAGLDRHSPVRAAYWSTIVAPRRDGFAAMIATARERGELPAGPPPALVLDLLAGALMYRALMHPQPLSGPAARRYVDDLVAALGLTGR